MLASTRRDCCMRSPYTTFHRLQSTAHQPNVRGVLLAKGPDPSVGGVPVGYCPDDVHMEDEVQLRVK